MAEEIREITIEDLNECARLSMDAFNAPPWSDEWTEETARQRIAEYFHSPGFLGCASFIEGKLVAFAIGTTIQWYNGRHFYLHEVAVKPELQQRGIGTRLMAYLGEMLKKNDIRASYLLTMNNDRLKAFYERHGFVTNEKMIMMSRKEA